MRPLCHWLTNVKIAQCSSSLLIGLTASVGIFLSTLDSSIMNVALPTLLRDFRSPIDHLIWIVTLYMLVLSSSIMLFGKLADRFGRLMIYKYGLILFGLSSLLCGFANNTNILILFRGIQGLGAAMMQATAAAMIMTQVNPSERPKIMAIFGVMTSLGPLMGPALGGLILSFMGWRWIFWLNLPICFLTLLVTKRLQFQEQLFIRPLNGFNLLLFASTMTLFLLMISMLSHPVSCIIYFSLIGGSIISLIALLVSEYYSKNPVVSRSLLLKPDFTLSLVGAIAFGGATSVAFIVPPLFFEQIKGYLPWQIGIIVLSTPLGMVVCARFSSYLIPKLGERKLMILGMLLMVASLLGFMFMSDKWNYFIFIPLLLIYGAGAGIFQTPNLVHVMNQASDQERASVNAFLRMLQNSGIAFAAAISAFFIASSSTNLLQGIRESWLLAVIMAGIALFGCIYIQSRANDKVVG